MSMLVRQTLPRGSGLVQASLRGVAASASASALNTGSSHSIRRAVTLASSASPHQCTQNTAAGLGMGRVQAQQAEYPPTSALSPALQSLLRQRVMQGELLPDWVLEQLLSSRLERGEAWLLDGYARTESQADWLCRHYQVDVVVELHADDATVRQRIAQRREQEGRVDDTMETLRRRVEVYNGEIGGVKRRFAEAGVRWEKVDAGREVESVVGEVIERIAEAKRVVVVGKAGSGKGRVCGEVLKMGVGQWEGRYVGCGDVVRETMRL